MIESAISMITSSFVAVSGWFTDVMVKTGGDTLLLVILFVVLSVRFLIGPIVGSGSDRARKSKGDSDNV